MELCLEPSRRGATPAKKCSPFIQRGRIKNNPRVFAHVSVLAFVIPALAGVEMVVARRKCS